MRATTTSLTVRIRVQHIRGVLEGLSILPGPGIPLFNHVRASNDVPPHDEALESLTHAD